jgi:uncharacterized membrane protein (DUF373 family)
VSCRVCAESGGAPEIDGQFFIRSVPPKYSAANVSRGRIPVFRLLERFEEIISRALLLMMAAVVLLTTIELGWILVKDVLTPPVFLLEIGEILELLGLFLLVLIGIELMHSVKIFIKRREIHLEAMLVVALVAVARKVIVLEPKELAPEAVLGLAAMALALTIGYYLVKRAGREDGGHDSKPDAATAAPEDAARPG